MSDLDIVRQECVELGRYALERLHNRLVGLTDEEYFWEPAPGCWSVRAGHDGVFRQDGDEALPDPDPAPLTTVAWRICHIMDVLSADRNATWLGLAPVAQSHEPGEPSTAAAALTRLDGVGRQFLQYLSTMDSASLPQPIGPVSKYYGDSTRLAFVLHQLDELVHHAAEIGTLRDLYRSTAADR